MSSGDGGKVLVKRKRIVNGSRGKLSVKAQIWINVCIKVQPEAISHSHVLHVLKWWVGRIGGAAEDTIESQAKVAGHFNRPDFQSLTLDFGEALFDGRC